VDRYRYQLKTFIKRETERLREVKTIDYIGYSREYQTYIFEKYVYKGQIIAINEHDFFKVKRQEIKTLASSPAITLNPKKQFDPSWWNDFHKVRGAKVLWLWLGGWVHILLNKSVPCTAHTLYGNCR
jgi:hypothetical protein